MPEKVIIMGAAGRDFHDFNVYFRENPQYEVVAFTATQIPDIEGRQYPSELAGSRYPKGIPILPESELPALIKKHDIDTVFLSYSDLPHEYVMHKASEVLAAGANFELLGPNHIQLKSTVPVISICAVRTGCGKSQTTRRVADILRKAGKKVVAVRHPMPYGDLREQIVQRYATYEDMDKYECTIEEREEYEPHIDRGVVLYAGVDYEKILREAEKEADIILWDGGNNDFSFYKSDLHIVVADPHRPGHESCYHPGEANIRMADVVVINKVDTAYPEDVFAVRASIRELAPQAIVVEAASPLFLQADIAGKDVLVVEDGPTLTHGGMPYGAGAMAAEKLGAQPVDPYPYAVGSIRSTFDKFEHLGPVLPAMGYGEKQIKELEETINAVECDAVIIGTPIDLSRIIKINKPAYRVTYELQEIGKPTLEDVLKKFL
ncbi:MAG: GTPase [Theionarchaea archaeon]|nr:GTPase [Theionarchaea archaeon]MBU6999243.1 GTPase [Theionarchaea archaeon]MBU7019632.1 GTPase [Theionarchaea archaeon]MBU7033811.1 GTPase [Theionarchaea archaeon]MBU7040221.1 GTPase [Theionarchaea archaeon]